MQVVSETNVSQDSRNMSTIMWVGTLFLGFLPSLIVLLVKKDDAYLTRQSKEALNWSITMIIGYIIGVVLSVILVGILVVFAVGIAHLAYCIMGAMATANGKDFKIPYMCIRLIK